MAEVGPRKRRKRSVCCRLSLGRLGEKQQRADRLFPLAPLCRERRRSTALFLSLFVLSSELDRGRRGLEAADRHTGARRRERGVAGQVDKDVGRELVACIFFFFLKGGVEVERGVVEKPSQETSLSSVPRSRLSLSPSRIVTSPVSRSSLSLSLSLLQTAASASASGVSRAATPARASASTTEMPRPSMFAASTAASAPSLAGSDASCERER